MRIALLVVFLGISSMQICAQNQFVTAGFQLRFLVPSELFTTTVMASNEQVEIESKATGGYGIGMNLRHVLNDRWALEGGMNMAVRKFSYNQRDKAEGYLIERPFQLNAFEIPLSIMVNAQLSPKSFINASAGFSLDIFTTEVKFNERFDERNEDYIVNLPRKSLLNGAVITGLGYELRRQEEGIFYIGLGYHLPFSFIYHGRLQYIRSQELFQIDYRIPGNYLSIDLRYFFPSNPD